MEGYYWRFGDPAAGWSVAAIAGVCRAADGPWAMITLAAEPGGFARTSIAPRARAQPETLGVDAGDLLSAGLDRVGARLGPDAWLEVELAGRRDWPRRAWGALGPAQAVPGLGQYWSPHLLGARVTGAAEVGGRRLALTGALAYAEKNWGAAFARHWWWGQGWLDEAAGVAFAGGRVRLAAPTAVVVWSPAGLVRLAPPLARTLAGAGGGEWRVRAASARWTVELEGEAAEAPLLLPVPLPAQRRTEPRSEHHLRGRLAVVVRRGRRVWLRGETALAGLEDGRPR
jgi:Tocopherol cyclase